MQEQPKGVDSGQEDISLAKYPEITAWCEILGCSEVQLAEAIAAVGYSAASVRAYLSGSRGATGRGP